MAKQAGGKKKPKSKPRGYQGPRGNDGKFLPPDGKRRVKEIDLGDYDTISEKAIAILAEDLYTSNKKDRREAAKLLAKLNPQETPKDVLDVHAREIVEYWMKGNVVGEDVGEQV